MVDSVEMTELADRSTLAAKQASPVARVSDGLKS